MSTNAERTSSWMAFPDVGDSHLYDPAPEPHVVSDPLWPDSGALMEPPAQLRIGDIVIVADTFTAQVGGRVIELTSSEYKILLLLASAPGRPVPTWRLMDTLGRQPSDPNHALRSLIYLLRKKLGPAGKQIRTEPLVGYSLARE